MQVEKVNLAQAFARFQEQWTPKIVGSVNDMHVKLSKLEGEFVWHRHDGEDELFLVVKGELTLRFRDGDVRLREGEFAIVPRGVEHLPVAEREAHVLLFEPKSTLNTGNVRNERTVEKLETLH
jgi:mannose-6-phosphate isomerase-like protein (cupin superfamily)